MPGTGFSVQNSKEYRMGVKIMPFLNRKIKSYIVLQGFFSLLEQFVSILFLYLVGIMTDCITTKDYDGFKRILFPVVVLLPVQMIVFYCLETVKLSNRKEYGYELQNRLYDRILYADHWGREGISKEKVLNLFNVQIERLQEYVTKISDIGVSLIVAAMAAFFIARVSVKLLVVSCILIPLSSYLFQVLAQPIQKENREILHKKEEVNEMIRQTLKGFYIIKVYKLRGLFEKRFQDCTEGLREREKKKDRIDMVLGRIYILLGYIPHLLVPLYGGYLGIRGEITLGDLIAVNMMIWYVLNPVQTFLSILREKRDIDPILEQMQTVFAVQEEQCETGTITIEGAAIKNSVIEMKNVSFSYDGQHEVLKDLNLCLQEGESLVLAGESGAGKSTFIKILCGLESGYQGTALLCGIPVCPSNQEKIRQMIAYVPQEPYLFQGTIEENIRLGEEATKEQVEFAAAMAEAHSFIMDFEKGYETVIGEGGVLLSGGQRKRIAMARALLRGESRLLLMDEPMSALPEDMAKRIIKNIFENFRDKTIFIISHKPSDFSEYSRIVRLSDGILKN